MRVFSRHHREEDSQPSPGIAVRCVGTPSVLANPFCPLVGESSFGTMKSPLVLPVFPLSLHAWRSPGPFRTARVGITGSSGRLAFWVLWPRGGLFTNSALSGLACSRVTWRAPRRAPRRPQSDSSPVHTAPLFRSSVLLPPHHGGSPAGFPPPCGQTLLQIPPQGVSPYAAGDLMNVWLK